MNMPVSWGGSHVSFVGLKGSWLGSENLFSVYLARSQRAASEENTTLLYFRLIYCIYSIWGTCVTGVWLTVMLTLHTEDIQLSETTWVPSKEWLYKMMWQHNINHTEGLHFQYWMILWNLYVQPSVINMFAYYRHCAWQLQWLNWWVFHNDVNAPLVLLHKSDNIKVYHPDLHSLKYCVSTVRTHHFLCWLWMAVDEHLVRSRKRGSSEECWAAHTRDRVTE